MLQLEADILRRKTSDVEAQKITDDLEELYMYPGLKFDEQNHARLLQEAADAERVLDGSKVHASPW